jgi:imidazolonepropionase-like amidohydrolase
MLLAFLLSCAAAASTADTTDYVVLNHGRPAGQMLVIRSGDTVIVKYHHVDRNRGPRSETRYVMSKGRVISGQTWNLPLNGPPPKLGEPADRFEVVRDSLLWRSRDTSRSAPYGPATFYRLFSFTPYNRALLARFLLTQPNHSARILPRGTQKLEIVADTTVQTKAGRRRVRLAMMRDTTGDANGVWLDDKNELFADQVGWFVTVKKGSEAALPALRAMEVRYRNANGAALARKVAPPASTAIAIVNGDVFDSEHGLVWPRYTVVIQRDRIVAVGPKDSVPVPSVARVIDATGMTVMPGMWDMHSHLFLTSQTTRAVSDLATGITTIRDMASDLEDAISFRDRSAAGTLAAPRAVLAGFIEGPGRWAGPTAVIVSTEDQARAWVARYDSLGFKQIKLYNLVQQDLVPAIADETHKRGLRLSGHVPRGLSTPAAVRLGYDEINHAAFLFSTFFPDSLYLPQMRAYSQVAAVVAPNVNVDGPEMTAMIDLFKQRGTVIDGTFNLWMRVPNASGAPNVTGVPNTTGDTLAQKSDANYLKLLKRLYDAGVTLVPGTDGSSYNSELELYERAGIPAAQVLRIATIVPARVMKDDKDYGSIAVDKVADIIIVNGKPAEHVSDLRKVERVIRAGRVYDSKALNKAIGIER